MIRVQPAAPAVHIPIDDDELDAPDIFNLNRINRVHIHEVPLPRYDGSKLFRILFVVQILLVIFTTDVSFYPVHAYGCNPYENVVWNQATQTEHLNYCPSCNNEHERRARRSMGCYQRCEKYNQGLLLLHDDTLTPLRKRNISQLFMSFPNPLCFEWSVITSNANDPDLQTEKFYSKKARAEMFDDYLSRAYIYSYCSFFVLIIWIVLYSCECHSAQMGCKIIVTFLFISSFIFYYLSIHFGYHVLHTFTCYHRIAAYDNGTRDFIQFEFEPFCKSPVKIPSSLYIYEDDVYEYLPEMPPSWTVSYYIWVIRALTPAVFIFYWLFRTYIGTDLGNSLYYPCLYVIIVRILRRIRQN